MIITTLTLTHTHISTKIKKNNKISCCNQIKCIKYKNIKKKYLMTVAREILSVKINMKINTSTWSVKRKYIISNTISHLILL